MMPATGLRPRRPPVAIVPSEACGPGIGHNGGPPLDGSGLAWAWRRASQRAWKTPPREIAMARLRQAEALGLSYREFTGVLMDRGQRLSAAILVFDEGRMPADPGVAERLGRLNATRTLVCLRGSRVADLPADLRSAIDVVRRIEGSRGLDAAIGAFLGEYDLPPAAVFMVGCSADDLAAAQRHGLALFRWAAAYFGGSTRGPSSPR